jgi:cytochrome b6-f complex iron-sulfur subunit
MSSITDLQRRRVLQILATAPIGALITHADGSAVYAVEIESLDQVWKDAEFKFANQPCLIVRLPLEAKAPRAFRFEHGGVSYHVSAYSRRCTHLGCTASLPNGEQVLICGCHGSEFTAQGDAQSGPASTPLRALQLELRDDQIWATAWLEP